MSPAPDVDAARETFGSRLGLVLTTVGVAVGLGNVWRFPYMAGEFGGAAFVLVYVAAAFVIGVPALAAEWTLGRHAEGGPVTAYRRAGLPGGRAFGRLLFLTVAAATAYYTVAVGWVVVHGLGQLAALLGVGADGSPWLASGGRPPGSAILPPEAGFDGRSFLLQACATAALAAAAAAVLRRGLREGIERASWLLTPVLFGTLLLLIARSATLSGAGEGVTWYLAKFRPSDLTGAVVLAALGQAVFSLALGGTFMVVYGSHMARDEPVVADALWTAIGDTGAGLLAGLAIFPAVFALGLEPAAGPDLIFTTLPRVFARMPAGELFGALFFLALGGGAFLSVLAALEVLVDGLVEELGADRGRAVWVVAGLVVLLALPPMVNLEVFLPWDLAFGSGMQTLGALAAAVTVGWALDRGRALEELASRRVVGPRHRVLHAWVRWVVPAAILAVGAWWVASELVPG